MAISDLQQEVKELEKEIQGQELVLNQLRIAKSSQIRVNGNAINVADPDALQQLRDIAAKLHDDRKNELRQKTTLLQDLENILLEKLSRQT